MDNGNGEGETDGDSQLLRSSGKYMSYTGSGSLVPEEIILLAEQKE
jgi:hypothetical protein